jgi:peptidoglycan/LPS O-acetylase OafA/YrhL
MKNYKKIPRFYLLDISRGFAALCVVLQHYQHFFYNNYKLTETFNRNEQPFWKYISFAYEFGVIAVPFFFILSGFIFFSFYREKIYKKLITFKSFIILRISRLYPLHLLTLVTVLLLQKLYYFYFSEFLIYSNNSFGNFILHLFLIQNWGINNLFNINSGSGFNNPSWSLSIELFLYILFFIISTQFVRNFTESIIFLIILSFSLLINKNIDFLFAGMFLFYLGGTIYFFTENIKKYLVFNKKIILLILLFFDVVIFGPFLKNHLLDFQNYIHEITSINTLFLFLIKFPLIILNLYIIGFYFKNFAKNFKIFGDLSYTIYLIHVPLQILIIFINNKIFNIEFNSNFFFILYFLLIFIISYLVYKYYELPFKTIIRRKTIKNNNI